MRRRVESNIYHPWVVAAMGLALFATAQAGCAVGSVADDGEVGGATAATSTVGIGGSGGTSGTMTGTTTTGVTTTATTTGTTTATTTATTTSTGTGGSPGVIGQGDLVITEIMNNPGAVADSSGEWFEVYNVTSSPLDLMGLEIVHIAAEPNNTHTISASLVIPAGGYVVLGNNGNMGTNGGIDIDYAYGTDVNLNNTADYLALRRQSIIIDEVMYDQASGLDPDGKSRNLNSGSLSAALNNDDTNFCESTTMISGSADFGTPGNSNTACP